MSKVYIKSTKHIEVVLLSLCVLIINQCIKKPSYQTSHRVLGQQFRAHTCLIPLVITFMIKCNMSVHHQHYHHHPYGQC